MKSRCTIAGHTEISLDWCLKSKENRQKDSECCLSSRSVQVICKLLLISIGWGCLRAAGEQTIKDNSLAYRQK